MNEEKESAEFMWVTTVDEGASRKHTFNAKIEVDTLAENMAQFLSQVEKILEKTPDTVQKFQLVEFEVEAQISAKGQLVLLGSGGEIGGSGGLKFLFRKVAVPAPETAEPASDVSKGNEKDQQKESS